MAGHIFAKSLGIAPIRIAALPVAGRSTRMTTDFLSSRPQRIYRISISRSRCQLGCVVKLGSGGKSAPLAAICHQEGCPASAAAAAYHRHDISDRAGQILEPRLPGGKGKVGRPAANNRRCSNAVFWVVRTGAPWRDLPPATATGATPTAALSTGAIKTSGPNCRKPWLTTPILSG